MSMSYNSYNTRASKGSSQYSKKAKRWYVDAQIPKSVPFVGGSSFKAGSGTLSKRSLTNLIKRTGEAKQKLVVGGAVPAMLQNTLYTFNPLGNIAIGTGTINRIGSSIFIKSFDIRMTLSLNGATSGLETTHFRILCVKIDQEYLTGSDAMSAGVGSTDLFVNGSNQMINAHIDPNKATVLYDEVHRVGGETQLNSQFLSIKGLIKDKSIRYATPTSNYSNFGNYYLVIAPYTVGKTSGVTIVGDVRFETQVNFTDA